MRNGGAIGARSLGARGGERLADSLLEGAEHLVDLLPDDRLQHALAHRPDRPGDRDVRRPEHAGAGLGVLERERGLHVHHRPDALALRVQARELELALLRLLEVDRHRERAEPERHLDLRVPVPVVLELERLHAGHQPGHLGRVVEDVPDDGARGGEVALALDLHAGTTCTRSREAAGSRSSSQTRWGGLHES